jgi:hypothetical protein
LKRKEKIRYLKGDKEKKRNLMVSFQEAVIEWGNRIRFVEEVFRAKFGVNWFVP